MVWIIFIWLQMQGRRSEDVAFLKAAREWVPLILQNFLFLEAIPTANPGNIYPRAVKFTAT
jgi:hypothetical protein